MKKSKQAESVDRLRKIRLRHEVRGDAPFASHVFAPAGIHEAHLNPHGAVSVIANDGNLLGVKPGEFEWVQGESQKERGSMNDDPNISVELTDLNELHCFKLTFRAGHPALADHRVPVEIMLHTRQAFDLFHKLGSCLMDYFATHSLDMLRRLAERDEARRILDSASHALRSYEYGNVATDCAKEMADAIDQFLATGEPQTLAGKQARK